MIAFVFPGQGSYRVDALEPWSGHPAASVLDEISGGLGRDVRELAADPTTGRRTADAQPAILAASLVAWRALTDAGVAPRYVAGHSLGEYTATVAAGVLTISQGAALVGVRGRAMGAACAAYPGTMAAVVKLAPEQVAGLVDGIDAAVVANDNAPGQIVVAGPEEALAELRTRAREAGGRALPLEVEGAFHSPAMASAVEPVREALGSVALCDPLVPVVSGATARESTTADQLAEALVAGMLAPVRWREVQLRLAELGVTDLVELGHGGVLAGLARRTVPALRTHQVAVPDDLDGLLATLSTPPRG